MRRRQRGRSAVADVRRRLRQQYQKHTASSFVDDARTDGQSSTSVKKSTRTCKVSQFLDLPLEIRRQIYGKREP